MSSKSDYLEGKVLEHYMGKTAFTMPTAIYMALCTVTPTDASTGSTLTEANYTGYARKQILATGLNAAAAGTMTNSTDIVFANATAGTSTIIGFAICDALTAGNVLVWGTTTSKVIDINNTPATCTANSLSISED